MRTLIILAVAFAVSGCEGQTVGVDVGRKAPEITGETVAGVPVKLSHYQGKVVLLDFWASWCGPCVQEMAHTLDLHRQYDGRPFAILGVNRDRTREDLRRFLDQKKLPWQNAYDAGGTISDQWNVSSLPTFVLIDHTGVVAGRWVGGGQTGDIEQAVGKAVKAAEGN